MNSLWQSSVAAQIPRLTQTAPAWMGDEPDGGASQLSTSCAEDARWRGGMRYIKKTFLRQQQQTSSRKFCRNSTKILDSILNNVESHASHIQRVSVEDLKDLPNEPILIENGIFDSPACFFTDADFCYDFSLPNIVKNCEQSYFRLDDNHTGRVRLGQFCSYMRFNQDDTPLYIFDSQFAIGADENRKSLAKKYKVPDVFAKDNLFSIVANKYRPPWQWILIGGPRSGTGIHIDPLGTSAWNAVLQGKKLWLFFPPDTPHELVSESESGTSGMLFFFDTFPKIVDYINHYNNKNFQTGEMRKRVKPYFVVQQAGEIVYVPCDWYHVVINLEDTVAITHNFAMKRNLSKIIPRVFLDEPHFGFKWLQELRLHGCIDIVTQIEEFLASKADNAGLEEAEYEVSSGDESWSGSDESIIDS